MKGFNWNKYRPKKSIKLDSINLEMWKNEIKKNYIIIWEGTFPDSIKKWRENFLIEIFQFCWVNVKLRYDLYLYFNIVYGPNIYSIYEDKEKNHIIINMKILKPIKELVTCVGNRELKITNSINIIHLK